MTFYLNVNISTKGMWSESEDLTLVEASSREAIVKAVLQGKDTFIEKRLLPCHHDLLWDIEQFRDDPDEETSDDEDAFRLDPDAAVRTLSEDDFIRKILKGIHDNSINR